LDLAVEYFSKVVIALDVMGINRHQLHIIAKFFIGRIEHWTLPGLKESFAAIDALAKNCSKDRFTDDQAVSAMNAILSHSEDYRDQPVASRRQGYKCILSLLTYRPKILSDLGERLVQQLVKVGSAEKDPDNLMMYFPALLVVEKAPFFDASKYANDVWDLIRRYFPITYKPPTGATVTAEDLKSALRSCIAGSNSFSPNALEFLKGKLDIEVNANTKVC
jgi:DNA repair/transcription protein MET18/MMS19